VALELVFGQATRRTEPFRDARRISRRWSAASTATIRRETPFTCAPNCSTVWIRSSTPSVPKTSGSPSARSSAWAQARWPTWWTKSRPARRTIH